MKNEIAKLYPNSLFMMASSNEGKTDGDILEMGDRLAKEVRKYVMEFCPGD